VLSILSDPGFVIPFALAQVFLLVVLIWALDLFEREPMAIVAAMVLWGATVAPAIAIATRGVVLDGPVVEDPVRRAMLAAVVEEPAKGLALAVVCIASWMLARRFGVLEFEGVTDGAVYGAAIGLGFAFTENLFYLVQSDTVATGLTVFVSRSDFGGLAMLGHAVYTGCFGIGLGLATWRRDRFERLCCAVGGLAVAVGFHAVHNGLLAGGHTFAARAADYGFVVVFALAVAAWLAHQKRILEVMLGDELDRGVLTAEQYRHACSPVALLRHQVRLLRSGQVARLRVERELQRELVELAFDGWRDRRLGLASATETPDARRRRITSLVG
jgi:RsiW-degrading membrane proteinase PrsW (M82 family)